MKTLFAIALILPSTLLADEGNPAIDYAGFQKLTSEIHSIREARRIPEEEFLRMAAEEGTVILDTRSKAKYDMKHIKGAIHLNFSDFTDQSLAKLIPDKTTRILIYCNNNFDGDPVAFQGKRMPLALNIPTFINLYGYGYENIYELKPYLDLKTTKIPFEGTSVLEKDNK